MDTSRALNKPARGVRFLSSWLIVLSGVMKSGASALGFFFRKDWYSKKCVGYPIQELRVKESGHDNGIGHKTSRIHYERTITGVIARVPIGKLPPKDKSAGVA